MKSWTPRRIGGTKLATLPDFMNKSALLLAVGSAFVIGLPLAASAYDDDPGYGTYRPWYGGEDRTYRSGGDRGNERRNEPIYYRPTMRYYAKGYTVSYRYVPVFYYEAGYGQQNISANFRTEAFRIATTDIAAWGAKPPRLVVANHKTPSQTAITSIVPTRSAPTYGLPDLRTPAAPLPTPNLDPSPLPDPSPKP